MSISKVLKSNNLVFFVIALILMGFAVHSLGKRKNSIVDSLVGHNDLKPYHMDDDSMLSDSDEMHSGQLMDETEYDSEGSGYSEGSAHSMPTHASRKPSVARVSTNVPKPTHTDPKELLPKDKSDSFHNRDLINAGRFISQQSEVLRNANLQIRSDPPVGKSETGPWNQTTIEPDMMRPQFELSGGAGGSVQGASGSAGGAASVSGFRKNCPMWMSSSIAKSGSAILPPAYKSVSSE